MIKKHYALVCDNRYDDIMDFFSCNRKVKDGYGEVKYVLTCLRSGAIINPDGRSLSRSWQKYLKQKLNDNTFRVWNIEKYKNGNIKKWIKKNP